MIQSWDTKLFFTTSHWKDPDWGWAVAVYRLARGSKPNPKQSPGKAVCLSEVKINPPELQGPHSCISDPFTQRLLSGISHLSTRQDDCHKWDTLGETNSLILRNLRNYLMNLQLQLISGYKLEHATILNLVHKCRKLRTGPAITYQRRTHSKLLLPSKPKQSWRCCFKWVFAIVCLITYVFSVEIWWCSLIGSGSRKWSHTNRSSHHSWEPSFFWGSSESTERQKDQKQTFSSPSWFQLEKQSP